MLELVQPEIKEEKQSRNEPKFPVHFKSSARKEDEKKKFNFSN